LTRIRVVERTGSTNVDLLADQAAVEGDWLVALTQDAGRGRQGREWVSESGNFFGSTLVVLEPGNPPAASLSLAAGLALIEAVDVATPGLPLMLKWPNDLLLGTAKLGGILLERNGDRVVAGFGLNLGKAPKIEGRDVAALNGVMLPPAFAPLLAGSFARLLDLWRTSEPEAFAKAWLARAHPVGTRLTIHTAPGEVSTGSFSGIELDGALQLRREDGTIKVIRAGDVEL
jgi:BirA family biotin operon repressor/biotin-[acetyl-CoA-carboxylase] ligase